MGKNVFKNLGIAGGIFLLACGAVFGFLLWLDDFYTNLQAQRRQTLECIYHNVMIAKDVNEIRIHDEWIKAEIARIAEEERLAAEKAEVERLEAERIAAEKRAAEEAARIAAEQAAIARLATLQEAIDYWLSHYRHGAVAVEIFDLKQNTTVVSYNANAIFSARSLYKLFYVYDAYAQIDAGLDDPNALYWQDRSLGYCLDIMISHSDNRCAEAMLEDPARLSRVAQLVRNLGLSNTATNGLSTSAHDIVTLMQHYYRHTDWSAASWQKFLQSALNQPYAYRKGLPSGFSAATVYNKTGFGGIEYHDAAIVEFPQVGAAYIIVVMTNNTSYTNIAQLGKLIEQVVLINRQ